MDSQHVSTSLSFHGVEEMVQNGQRQIQIQKKKKKILNKGTSDTSDGIIDTLLGDKARQGLQGTGLSGSRCDS